MISTRTPEGEPLRCMICDAIHMVLVSRPPGDTVCPSCGAHSWMPVADAAEPFPSADISRLLPGFLDRLRMCKSKRELGSLLVDGISLCVEPTYVRLWLVDSRKWSYSNFHVVAARGNLDCKEFGIADALEVDGVCEVEELVRNGSLRTLVPLFQKDRTTVGVLEMQHSATIPKELHQSRLRLVRSVNAVATGTHLLD
jgi:hypothetical protein